MSDSGRKTNNDKELCRRVLDVAEEIVAREGVRRVTMRRIAAAVGYAPTVLYRLFDSKADLMDHLITRGYEGVRRRYEEVPEQPTALAALRALLLAYVVYALEHRNHYGMWFNTGVLRLVDGRMRMRHGRIEYTVFQTWLERIEACQAEGSFPDRPAQDVFQTLWARVHGLISLRLQHPEYPWPPPERHLDEVLGLPAARS
jgi:AcrR family transcriptional regulator